MHESKDRIEALVYDLKDSDALTRENSAYLLGEIGAEAIELTRNTLKDDQTLSDINAMTVPEIRDHVIQCLINALFDEDSWVRGNAADALGKLRAADSIEALLACLRDPEKVVRFSATQALGLLAEKSAMEDLVSVLSDEDWSVRMAAAEALGRLEDERAIVPLKRLKNDSKPDVQIISQEAIERITSAPNKAVGSGKKSEIIS